MGKSSKFLSALCAVACSREPSTMAIADASVDMPAASAASFPAIARAPGRAEYSFEHGGVMRSFIVYVPNGAIHAPLMLVLHGGGGSAKQMFDQHPLEPHADQTGFVMVAAQGTPKMGGGYDWNAHAALDSGEDDVGYLERVLLGVTAALEIDPKRRYVAGFSGGASMTIRFGAEKSQHVTAIGTFAGKVGITVGTTPPFVYPATPATPISVQLTYGTLDDNYTGGSKDGHLFTSGKEGIGWWASALSCSPAPMTTINGKLTFDTYSGCASGTVTRMITVEGMGHMWPDKADGLDGTKLLLDFFANKTKP